jgi:hypothetical protein
VDHFLRRRSCLVGAFFALAAGSLGAQRSRPSAQAAPPMPPAKQFCWQGRPLARCRTFALFELTTRSHWFGSKIDAAVTRPGVGFSRDDDGLASHIVGDVGAMVNISSRAAVGGTLTAGSVQAGGKPVHMFGATVRYRRWLTPSISADAGGGILRIPVGTVVQKFSGPDRENVPRLALAADVRLGFRDLLSVTGRFMVATDGQGRTHHALFVGAATGSKITAAIAGTFAAWVLIFSPRGDRVTVPDV